MSENDFDRPLSDFDDDHDLFDDEPKGRPRWFKLVGLLVVAGLIYITGVQQALFYRRTPLGTPQEETESIIGAETVIVHLRVFVFRNDGNFGSSRTLEDIRQMVVNASVIWDQGDIDLVVDRIIELDATDAEIGIFLSNPGLFISGLEDYDPEAINVFLAKSLAGTRGVNGLAFGGIRATAVADFTTVYDFRVFAHEIGHILGLHHVPNDQSRLMYRGANGFGLIVSEAITAREFASEFSN